MPLSIVYPRATCIRVLRVVVALGLFDAVEVPLRAVSIETVVQTACMHTTRSVDRSGIVMKLSVLFRLRRRIWHWTFLKGILLPKVFFPRHGANPLTSLRLPLPGRECLGHRSGAANGTIR